MSYEAVGWCLRGGPDGTAIPTSGDGRKVGAHYVWRVLVCLAEHADCYGRRACPSKRTIAAETQGDEWQVGHALRWLEAAGYIVRTGKHVPRKHGTVYLLPHVADWVQLDGVIPTETTGHLMGDSVGNSPADSVGGSVGIPPQEPEQESKPNHPPQLPSGAPSSSPEGREGELEAIITEAADNIIALRTPVRGAPRNPEAARKSLCAALAAHRGYITSALDLGQESKQIVSYLASRVADDKPVPTQARGPETVCDHCGSGKAVGDICPYTTTVDPHPNELCILRELNR